MRNIFFLLPFCFLFFVSSAISKPLPKLIPYRKGDKWGFADSTKKIIVPCKFSSVDELQEGYAAVYSGRKFGYIDSTGKIYHEAEFQLDDHSSYGTFIGNFMSVMKNGKVGMINKKGNWIVQPIYDYLEFDPQKPNEIFAQKNKMDGFIDTTGKILFPFVFESAEHDARGCYIVSKNQKWGVVDKNQKIIIPLIYDLVNYANEGIYCVSNDSIAGKVYPKISGYIDSTGKMIHKITLRHAGSFNEGLAAVAYSNQYGYINTKGNYIVVYSYDYASEFSCGRACVTKNGRYGYINRKGLPTIPLIYFTWNVMLDRGESFQNNLCKIEKNGKCGIIDTNGVEIIPCEYSGIWWEQEYGFYILGKGYTADKQKIFYPNGKLINSLACRDELFYKDGPREISVAGQDSIFYYLTATGDTLNHKIYHRKNNSTYFMLKGFHDGYGLIFENGKVGMIDASGKTVVECKYDAFESFFGGMAQIQEIKKTQDGTSKEIYKGYLDHYGTEYWEE